MKTDLFQSCGHCRVFQICWHIECSTFTASSFRIWNHSAGIPSPPLALFVVMLSEAHWLHFHFSLSCIGGRNGSPLQCSCLENPGDGGAWWAAVYGVAQSRIRLKWLSSSSSSSGSNGSPVELFQTPKDDAVKVLYSICQQIWKSNGHRTGKGQFSFQYQRKAMPKNAQTTAQLHASHTLVK